MIVGSRLWAQCPREHSAHPQAGCCSTKDGGLPHIEELSGVGL